MDPASVRPKHILYETKILEHHRKGSLKESIDFLEMHGYHVAGDGGTKSASKYHGDNHVGILAGVRDALQSGSYCP
jgi:hypothetical protein